MEQKGIKEVDTRKPEDIGDYKQKVYGIPHYKRSDVIEQHSHAGLEFLVKDIDEEIARLQEKKTHYEKAMEDIEEIIETEPKISKE